MQSPSPDRADAALPRLVIVVPTKDRRVLLERALGSVLSQSYAAYRIVIINDGSTDGTREYLDSLKDSRIRIIHHEKSRGVNAARNAALRTVTEGEWVVPLDDDDMLLPGALETMARAAEAAPSSVQVLFFNTIIQKPEGEIVGGREFKEGEQWLDSSYESIMTGGNRKLPGDGRPILKWTLFPQYYFSEDINGFEGEWWQLLARDGVRIRYLPQQTTWIDLTHPGEHLSAVAARRDRSSFIRAHLRVFRDHKEFFAAHPRVAMGSAIGSFKNALRAYDIPHALIFVGYYLQALARIFFRRRSQK